MWRCTVCRKGSRSEAKPGPGKCVGSAQPDLDAAESNAHVPALFHVSDGSDCFLCVKCGAFLHHGVLAKSNLANRCP
eukprot:5813895-Pyramimonas_sp.AAC.1